MDTMKEITDHDLLIAVRNDIGWLKRGFANHLQHHWMISLCSIAAALSAFTALVFFLLGKIWT